MELLKGLMDSDGYIEKNGSAIFYNTNIPLILQVKELIESLGYKVKYNEKIPKIKDKEYTKCGILYFKPRECVTCSDFKCSRFVKTYLSTSKRNQYFYIKDIKEVESVPVRCITVDSPDSLYLCGKGLIPTHNSTIVSMYALWLVCFHEYKKVAILANKADTAMEIFSRIKMAFEELPVYLKPAVKSNRKNGFDLSNGSSIIVSSTSASAVRGQSINCVTGDTIVTLKDKKTEEIFKINLKDLEELLKNNQEEPPHFIVLND
jgi:hypothetical protein